MDKQEEKMKEDDRTSEVQQTFNRVFLCPSCMGELVYIENKEYYCNSCKERYPLFHDIPMFSRNREYYYGEMPKPVFDKLLNLAFEVGTQNAMNTLLRSGEIGRGAYNYGSARNRGAFFPLLNIGTGKRVLDLGCGWGNVSLSLARIYKECFAMDLTKERILFLKMRASEAGYTNLFYICGGDLRFLPFKDGFFDCVVLNGVLEWVPEMEQRIKPYEVQLNFLREIGRILNKKGQVYIAIENRFALQYLTGMREDHTGMLFTSFMPRPIANMVSKKIRGKPYRTWTYSKWGYRKLLKESGFMYSKFWVPWPNYRQFNIIYSLGDSDRLLRHIRKHGYKPSWKTRIKVELTRYMNHSFSIVATKNGTSPESWLEHFTRYVTHKYSTTYGEFGPPEIEITPTSGIGLSYRGSKGAGLYIGMPVDGLSEENHRKQFENLQYINSAFPEIASIFSVPVEKNVLRGVSFYVYSLIDYTDVLKNPRDVDECFIKVSRIFSSKYTQDDRLPENLELKKVLEAIRSCSIQLKDESLFLQKYNRLLEIAGNLRHPMHGDFWGRNVVMDKQGHVFLIDWADFSKFGLPLHDLFHYVLFDNVGEEARFEKMIHIAYSKFPLGIKERISSLIREVYDPQLYKFDAKGLSALYILYLYEHVVRRARRRLDKRDALIMLLELTLKYSLPLSCFEKL